MPDFNKLPYSLCSEGDKSFNHKKKIKESVFFCKETITITDKGLFIKLITQRGDRGGLEFVFFQGIKVEA